MKKHLAMPALRFANILHHPIILILLFILPYIVPCSLYTQDSRVYMDKYENYSPDFSLGELPYYIPPGETVKIPLTSGSISLVSVFRITVYRISDPEKFIMSQASVYGYSFIGKDSSNLLGLAEEVSTFTKKVYPYKRNSNGQFMLKDTITYQPERKGVYIVRVMLKNKAASVGFFVTSLSLTLRMTKSSLLTYTSNRNTSEPEDSVKLSLYLGGNKVGEALTINAINNYLLTEDIFKKYTKKNKYYPFIIAVKGEETAVSDPGIYFKGITENYKAYISTSQPVYRPPDVVRFKITLRKEILSGYEVYAKKRVIVYVTDPSGGNILRKAVFTDDYGGYSDSVLIAKESPLGNYKIKAEVVENNDGTPLQNTPVIINRGNIQYDDDWDYDDWDDYEEPQPQEYKEVVIQSFEQAFTVDEYKKPEYKIEVKTDKQQYGTGETMEISAQADYYFGSPVQEGEVEYNIYKKPLYRPWWYYSEYSWWYRDFYTATEKNFYIGSEYIFTGKGRLDKDGKFETTYKINEDFKEGKKKNTYSADYQYIVTVYVTDKTRRKIIASTDVNVTRAEFQVNAYSDRYVVKPGEKIGLTVKTRDFSDKPIEENFTVTVNRITYEKEKNKPDKKVTTYVNTYSGKTSSVGDEVVFIETTAEGYYEMEVTAFDSRNTKITSGAGTYVSNGNIRSWWEGGTGKIEIIPDKPTYKPGDTANALLTIPDDSAWVLVETYNRDIVSAFTEYIKEGSAYISIPLTDNSAPNIFLSVSYVKDDVIHKNNVSFAVIPEKKFLNVELSSDKTVYKPREEGVINISVKDKLGNPVKNTEVTIGMLDESIYAIEPDNLRDIRSVFYSAAGDKTKLKWNENNNNLWVYNSADYLSLFEMYNYRTNYEISSVYGTIYDEFGSPFPNAEILINGKFKAGYSGNDGSFKFIIPQGEYNIQLVYDDYIIPGYIKTMFKKEAANKLEIKTSLWGIQYAALNDEIVQSEIGVLETTMIPGTITGEVIDQADRGPVIGAIIKIEGTNKVTETDKNGKFSISGVPTGIYNIVATYAGYQPVKINGVKIEEGKGVKLRFEFISSATMDTVEIIAQRKGIQTDQSGRLITSQNIEETGIRGVQNIVSKTSGVVQDETSGVIDIRGGRTSQNLIIVDGVATNNPLENEPEEEQFIDAVTRDDFRDAVLWMPSVITDENGRAEVRVKFPDNLTTWRVFAKAITKTTEVGQTTYDITERKDLIIRVEVPRFFQQNDEVTVSTIVHNYLNEEKKTKVTLRLDNLLLAGSTPYEKEIVLGKNEERRLDWNVKVYNPLGTGKVYASALTNEESDAMEQKIPIQPFGLKINKFTSFNMEGTETFRQTFEIPANTDVSASHYELSVAPSIASSLTGSLDYLIGYPYGCIEQTMSRFVPTVLTAATLKEMNAPEDSYFSQQIPLMVKKGYEKVYSMQSNDGGWGWWKNSASDPYMTAYVVYSMNIARKCGFSPAEDKYFAAVNYLKLLLEKEQKKKSKSKKIQKQDIIELSTRALIMLALSESDTSMHRLVNRQFEKFEGKDINPLAMSWLSLAAGNTGRTDLQRKYITDIMRIVNSTEENSFYWGGKVKRYNWYEDILITTSMAVKAVMAEPVSAAENRDVVERAVKWLLSQKRGASWGNTQQSAYVIFALSDYIKKYHELEADYTVKIYINGTYAAEKHITRDDIFKPDVMFLIPPSMLKSGANEITVEKTGSGKAYVNGTLTYYEADTRKTISETDNGFEITREYFKLKKEFNEKAGNYTYKKIPMGENPSSVDVTSGDEIFVKVKVTPASAQNDYFMLEEPLPAGCEYIKEEWAYAIEGENSYQGKSQVLWNWWYGDRDIRDNRIVYFASNLNAQEYEFSYLLRAQIPGTYNIMPSRGMLMYYPDVNGSANNLVLKISDKPAQ